MSKRRSWLRHALPAALVMAFLGTGCAAQTHVVDPPSAVPAEDVLSGRAAIEHLREHRYAKEVAMDLARAARWLDDADRRVAEGAGEEEVTQLTLLAVRTQIAAVKSFYLRREAQDALETARAGYAQNAGAVRLLEIENREIEELEE